MNRRRTYTTFYEKALKEQQRLEKQLVAIEKQLSTLPKGKLFCTTQNNYVKWYVTTKDSCTYIPKRERKYAEQLALKKLLLAQQKDWTAEKKALDFYLRHHKSDATHTLLTEKAEYRELLAGHFTPLNTELAEWAASPFEGNSSHPEQLQYKTSSGIFVRSKSESMIELLLRTHKIPFRYEAPLKLDNITLYPDFTIRHPISGEYFYWEHFGMMDDPSYQKTTFSKLQLYSAHGILPTLRLITTYETKEQPLSTEYIETLLHYYFH